MTPSLVSCWAAWAAWRASATRSRPTVCGLKWKPWMGCGFQRCPCIPWQPGTSKKADALYTLKSGAPACRPLVGAPAQQALFDLLTSRGPLRGRQIDRALPRSRWRAAAEALEKRGLLSRQSVLEPPTAHAKHVHTARLSASLSQVQAARPGLSLH